MTPSPSVFDRARQGDLEAIATLLQQRCDPMNVVAKVALNGRCLQVLLEGRTVPSRTSPTLNIANLVQQLCLPNVETLKIYGKAVNEARPAWETEYPASPNLLDPSTVVETMTGPPADPRDFWRTLRTFEFSAVVPYREVFQSSLYRSPLVRGLLFFGLAPVALGYVAEGTDLSQIAWLLGIYYASFWGVFLYNLIRPSDFSWRKTLTCVLFTAFVGIPMLLFVQQVPPFSILYAATNWGLFPRMVGFVLGVGVLEETCKALSVYFFLLRPRRLHHPMTAAFYGTMSGLGFAVAEGATYSLGYAITLVRGEIPLESYVLVNTIRFISLPLFHAVLAGIVGYFLGLSAINPSRQWSIIFIGIAIAAVLHGAYNTFAGGPLGFLVLAFTIVLFVVYLRRSQQMVLDMEQAEAHYRDL